MTERRRRTRCTRSSTPSATPGEPSTSSAATRTTRRCRWTTSCGRSSAATERGSSTPASSTLDAHGAQPPAAAHRGRGAGLVGVDAATVTDVVLTHLHYDHVGGFDQFPNARFHVQDREMAFATGRHMTRAAHTATRSPATTSPSWCWPCTTGGWSFHDGDDELAPGSRCTSSAATPTACRSCGCDTDAGWLVLASDATHYYENMETGRPFPIVFDVGAMIDGYDTLRRLADRARRDRARPRPAGPRALPAGLAELGGHRRTPRPRPDLPAVGTRAG